MSLSDSHAGRHPLMPLRVATARRPWASHVAQRTLLTCRSHYPGELRDMRVSVSSAADTSLPRYSGGSASTSQEAVAEYTREVEDSLSYILSTPSYDRTDRLFPADGEVFRTNPLSLAYGACGVAYALHVISGSVPIPVVEWILSADRSVGRNPPGLYYGLAGIAWALLEMGATDAAGQAMRAAIRHPLRYDAPDLFIGIAGWGLASLRFYTATGDEEYLQAARDAGDRLLQTQQDDGHWQDGPQVLFGLGHGASGIALFLLYLYLASAEERYLAAGLRGLDHDLAAGIPRGNGISWPRARDSAQIVFPYLKHGSAGVGMALLRYSRLLAIGRYQELLDRVVIDAGGKYSILPGFLLGLAGRGHFFLDLFAATGDQHHLDEAYRIASGLALYGIPRATGLAFPGRSLRRISCDFGTGSAGVACFLHRLTHPTLGTPFFLDELFQKAGSGRGTLQAHSGVA